MMECPMCKSRDTLRRGGRLAGRTRRYFAACLWCGSFVSIPEHEYFQLYSLLAASAEQPKQRHAVSA